MGMVANRVNEDPSIAEPCGDWNIQADVIQKADSWTCIIDIKNLAGKVMHLVQPVGVRATDTGAATNSYTWRQLSARLRRLLRLRGTTWLAVV
jgi:hypothetical protein